MSDLTIQQSSVSTLGDAIVAIKCVVRAKITLVFAWRFFSFTSECDLAGETIDNKVNKSGATERLVQTVHRRA